MMNFNNSVPKPYNEPVRTYEPGSQEKESLKKEIERQKNQIVEIPLIIDGKEVRTGNKGKVVSPHDHNHILAEYHIAGEKEIQMAIDAACRAGEKWSNFPWDKRAAVFLKLASLVASDYRDVLNASTILGQSKTVQQSEIDAACEMADFLRFNVSYMENIYNQQPESAKNMWNRMEFRSLEGFVFAITPFNFTAIAGNLVTAPAMMGNPVVWKPSTTALLSNYYLMKLYKEAGMPDGVVNFIPGPGSLMGEMVLKSENLAGIHFTGSTGVFAKLWQGVGENLRTYKSFPRLVGETGGKDYIFMHNSADIERTAVALTRGSFEYQGQKCSACSRAYIPVSKWGEVKSYLDRYIPEIKMGDPTDFRAFMGAVIDEKSFDNTMNFINRAKESADAEIIYGGNGDKTKGYFIEPTVILAKKPDYETMSEELFAPVLTIYLYEDDKLEETLELVDKTTPYALTGAVFARDRYVIDHLTDTLKHTAGNFYINDKPTGAVVGQQPFGGGRASGTNDKAGSYLNLLRWTSPRTLKECFLPHRDWKYPHMKGE